jgi:hypothetical protein
LVYRLLAVSRPLPLVSVRYRTKPGKRARAGFAIGALMHVSIQSERHRPGSNAYPSQGAGTKVRPYHNRAEDSAPRDIVGLPLAHGRYGASGSSGQRELSTVK